jgi:hypothetical protein
MLKKRGEGMDGLWELYSLWKTKNLIIFLFHCHLENLAWCDVFGWELGGHPTLRKTFGSHGCKAR